MLRLNVIFWKELEFGIKVRNLFVRKKSFSSNEWLKRRDTDIYYEKAKKENYRCRSAFKLIEIDDKYKLVKPGDCVIDIGASPGSWSQVLATRTNSNGKDPKKKKGLVIAIDLAEVFDIEGVTILKFMDFTKKSSQEKISNILGSRKLDFVLSDMAPKATGVKGLDQENISNLALSVVVFAVTNLKVGGGCLVKIWEGQHIKIEQEMKRFFSKFKYVRPSATYDSSSEVYMLGRDFVGLKQ